MNVFILTSEGYTQRRCADQLMALTTVLPGFTAKRDEHSTGAPIFLWGPATIRIRSVQSAKAGWRIDLLINFSEPESRTEAAVNRWFRDIDNWKMGLTKNSVFLDLGGL